MALLENMRVFARVVELGSLSAAGRHLRLSPAVVSHRLQQLERHLGVRLLNRTTREIQATEQGAAFYEACQEVLAAVQHAESVVMEAGGSPQGNLRVTAPLGLGRRTFDGAGTATALAYPDVYAAHRLIVALRRGRFRDPGLRTRGPLGLGTDFESIRDYQPDDDVRQINWTATARVGEATSPT